MGARPAGLSVLSLVQVSLLTRPSPPEKWKPFAQPGSTR